MTGESMQKRIMVVDDSMLVTGMISHYLCHKGYEVRTSNSPFGILNTIKEFTPHVLLIDLGLPGLRGETVARLCRETGSVHQPRIIVISSEDEDDLRQVVASGLADDYFTKGTDFDLLELKIASLASTTQTPFRYRETMN